jgi:hypothetical protein
MLIHVIKKIKNKYNILGYKIKQIAFMLLTYRTSKSFYFFIRIKNEKDTPLKPFPHLNRKKKKKIFLSSGYVLV